MRVRGLALGVLLLGGLGSLGCEQLLTRPILYGTVRVEAVSRSGAALPGVRVELYTSFRPMGYAITDAAGHAVFSRVPRAQYGVVMGLPPEYALVSELLGGPPGNRVDGLNVDAGSDTTLRFVFARRGNGIVEATVVDQLDVPIAGVTVTLYRSSGVLANIATDLAGLARFTDVPFGQYGVLVVPPSSLGVPGAPAVVRDGLAVDADVPATPRLVVQRCLGTIRPQVLDQDNLPVVGMPVTLYHGGGEMATESTGADGRTSFTDVPCGNWGVYASGIAGYTVDFVRNVGFVDGLGLTNAATLTPTLRATRQ
ncbi:MAG: hypothetical protein KF709_01135 [Gemmatimonadaceae bacterium]|nr:hypothetical protein [Gemmatimonadaceae bacterium]